MPGKPSFRRLEFNVALRYMEKPFREETSRCQPIIKTGMEISGGPSPRDDSFCVGPADRYLSESAGPANFGGALRSIHIVHYDI